MRVTIASLKKRIADLEDENNTLRSYIKTGEDTLFRYTEEVKERDREARMNKERISLLEGEVSCLREVSTLCARALSLGRE